VSLLSLAQSAWGTEFNAPDHGAYCFSNGRKFDSTDRQRTGIYGVEVSDGLLINSDVARQYPDMYPGVILDESGNKITKE
jgi:hypothetical protein